MPADDQLELVPAAVRVATRRRSARPPEPPAEVDPVADVAVDVPLPHLDRLFEYTVPASMADSARPGVRVRVRFAGQDVEGFVVRRKAVADHTGALAPLRRVVSSEQVLSAGLWELCRAVSEHWAGATSDVLRLAVPPRHGRAEARSGTGPDPAPARPAPGPWQDYPAGQAMLDRLAGGDPVRAAWTALPAAGGDRDWPTAVAVAVATALSAGRGALVVVPDHRDVARVDARLAALVGADRHVCLTADLGPEARYAAWLRVSRGQVRAVVGTRAAMFAPVHDLGLVICWDDGDDLHSEPRAPYPHARDVLIMRAERAGAAALLGGFTRSAEVEQLVRSGWARPVVADAAVVRRQAPRVLLAGEGHEPERDAAAASARLPSLVWRTVQTGLRQGPVLIQVPRWGYVPGISCQACREPARCPTCHGPLGLVAGSPYPVCRWCARVAADWTCPACGHTRVRTRVVGSGRTAEELGRAFPGVPVRMSGGATVLADVPDVPSLVVATPGAEPVAARGYAAAVLLDAWALLVRADLRAGEEALRRWMNAGALVRGDGDGGRIVLVGPAGLRPVEALVRWSPTWFAGTELDERASLGFPPAATLVTLTGPPAAVSSLARLSRLPDDVERLGPVPLPHEAGAAGRPSRPAGLLPAENDEPVRLVLRAAPGRAGALVGAVRSGAAIRSARKEPGVVRVQRDPLDVV